MMGYGYGSGDQRVNAVIDMINGGGQGRAGQQFEGGGLLSMLGNAFAQPYGAEQRGAQAPATSMQPMARPASFAPASFATAMPIQSTMPAQVPVYSGRGDYGMPEFSLPLDARMAPTAPPSVPFGGYDVEYNPVREYGGRGSVDMPMPPFVAMTPNSAEAAGLIDYLRRAGVQGY